jgi:hypothetical protein
MHRKKTRRWHKLLSVSGIIVAVFGMFYVPAANAELGGPVPDGLYGPVYSKDDSQVWYLDLPNNVTGFENTDMYVTGTATGCVIDSITNGFGFSFGFWVRGCSDGNYRLNLKAESITYQNGMTGPTVDYVGSETTVDRSPLTIEFVNTPIAVEQPRLEFQIQTNHPMVYLPYYDFSISGAGCNVVTTYRTDSGLAVVIEGCLPGAKATLTLNPNSIQDKYGSNGPLNALTSSSVDVIYAVATETPPPSPSPTPTSSATPTASPTATATPTPNPTNSPTASPTATPSSRPRHTDAPASVAVANPPTDPPAPPTAPESPPILEVPTEQAVSVPAPKPVVHSKTAALPKRVVETPPIDFEVEPPTPVIEVPSIAPVIEPEVRESFNWQPIGYLALAIGGAAATIGGGIMLQRMVRVRRLRFG